MDFDDDMEKHPFTVFVEGNVGSGKSTLLNHFKKFDEFFVLDEPIDKWTNVNGYNLLDLRFKDPDRFLFTFQHYATLTRLRQHLEPSKKHIKMMERSLLTARRCFVQNLYDTKQLHEGMFRVLDDWYEFVNDFHQIRCDLIVYMRTTPEVAFERITQRGREEETTVSLDYLKQLHQRHEDLFLSQFSGPPVVVIDANKNLNDIQSEYQKCCEEIAKHYEMCMQPLQRPNSNIKI